MNRTLFAALVFASLATPHAFAGDAHEIIILENRHLAAADNQADVWKRWADEYSRDMRSSMGTMFAGRVGVGKVVKGAPYSAEVVTESNQALADGNVITRRSSGAVYRDGEGRTRQESGGDGPERTIYITDPVDAKSYVLTPGAKRAVATTYVAPKVFHFSEAKGRDDGKERVKDRRVIRVNSTEIRIEDGRIFVDGQEAGGGTVNMRSKSGKDVRIENGKVFIDGRELTVPTPPTPPTPGKVVVRTIEGEDGGRREEVRVQVLRHGDEFHVMPPAPPAPPAPPGTLPPLPPMPPMPGIQTMRFESTSKLGKGVTTKLGMKDFDGVKAEGHATTWTIAAGEIGNRNPIHVVSESWYSPELQVTVYSSHNDPRTGQTVYRLSGIRRGEPGADLFRVPEEYKLRDRTQK